MIIKFLRSSASPPVINLKMCQEESFDSYEYSSTLNEENASLACEDPKFGSLKHSFRSFGKMKKDKREKKNLHAKGRARKGPNTSYRTVMTPHFGVREVTTFARQFFAPVQRTHSSVYAYICSLSCLTYIYRFTAATLLECCPSWFMRRFFSEDMYNIYLSRYYFERVVVSRFSGTETFVNVLAICQRSLTLMRPNPSNIDIWTCYLISVRESKSFLQFSSITYTALRALGFDLLSPYVNNLFRDVVNNNFAVQSDDGMFHDFISMFNSSFDIYKIAQKSPAAELALRLLTMLVSFASCRTAGLQFSICGVKLFRDGFLKSLERTKPTITDIFDLAGEIAQYFTRIGYLCFKHRSFRPLLFDDNVAYEMATLHVSIVSSWSAIQDMAWEVTPFVDDVEFRQKAASLISYYKELYSSMSRVNTHEAVIIQRKWQEIDSMLQTLTRLMLCGELRKAPFGVLIHGGSSVGKSTFTSMVSTVSIIAQGGDPRAEMRKVTNPNDEFFSNYSYGTEAIILDDMCNTKTDFTQKSPLEKIIEYINNVPAYPVMADLSSKGKIPLCPKAVIVTTNVDGLNAKVYSNEPVSILRRFNIWINLQVKQKFAIDPDINPENYMLDKNKVIAHQEALRACGASEEEILMPDIWNIRMWTVKSGNPDSVGGTATIVKVPICPDSVTGDAIPVDILTALDIITRMSKQHSLEQVNVVKQMKSIPEFLSNKMAEEYPHKQIDPQFIDIEEIRGDFLRWTGVMTRWSLISSLGPTMAALTDYRNCLPLLAYYFPAYDNVAVPLAWGVSWIALYMRSLQYRAVYNRYYRWCTADGRHIFLANFALGYVLGLIIKHFWALLKEKIKPQGNLAPLSMEELDTNATKKNVWIKPHLTRVAGFPNTHVPTDLQNKVQSNIVLVVAGKKFVNGFFVRQNYFVVPHHFLKLLEKHGDNTISIVSQPAHIDGVATNNHTQVIFYSREAWRHVPGTDLCVYYMANSMPRKEVLDYFPQCDMMRSLPATLICRDKDANVMVDTAYLNYGTQDTGPEGSKFLGHIYNLEKGVTFNGMCTSVWVSDTKPSFIAGFHLGGVTGTNRGCSGVLYKSQIEAAISDMSRNIWSSVDIPAEGVYDTDFSTHFSDASSQLIDDVIAPKHPVNFLPPESNIHCFGSNGGTHKYRTKVQYRRYGLEFLKDNDIPVQHGKPNMDKPPSWYHFSKNLTEFATVSKGPPTHVLNWAVLDYMLPIKRELRRLGFGTVRRVRPLTDKENINGVPGVRFLDALKVSTAAGFPLKGKTSVYLEGPDGDRDFISSAVWQHVKKSEDIYLQGGRCYHVFVAHLKDEPVKLGKDKVRVFFGNGTVFKLLIRKYWLPVVRLLSELSLLSECAIGINSHGVEWEEFMSFVAYHGEKRCVAGDYKGYDQKEFLNVIQASYRIYIELADSLGYSACELQIMRAMVADLSLFCVQYYGAVLMMSRGNPSGQNLTSYVNSTANSLNSRCAYYQAHGGTPPPFRNNVHMMTYGDDDIGTVSNKCGWYNAQVKAYWLNQYGILYTPPTKEGEHDLFYHVSEVDFLKRQTVYIPELQRRLGALSESSIIKSLSCGIPVSHMTEEELFGDLLDGALLEYVAHGRAKYEEFRDRVNRFVETRKFHRFVRTNHLTFDDRITAWLLNNVKNEPHIGYHGPVCQQNHRLVWETTLNAEPPGGLKRSPGCM